MKILSAAALALTLAAAPLAAHSQFFGQPRGTEPATSAGPVAATPFQSFALAFRAGTGGLGGELALPVYSHLALRAGAQFFGYNATFSADGVNATGHLSLDNIYAVADFFPFRRSSFHLSPGLAFRAANTVHATFLVPAGQTLTLNDTDYISAMGDPISGTAHVVFGNNPATGSSTRRFPVAPRLTAGFGSMFPAFHRLSFPTEFGVEFNPQPALTLTLAGSGCNNQGCGPIDDPDNQANVNGEIAKLNNDLAPLRFYPILSFGVAFRLAH